jgi:hypothetical protein
MREIVLPFTQTFSLTIDLQKVDMSKAVDAGEGRLLIPLGTISNEEIGKTVEMARKNGGKILYATTSIEQRMEALLLEYFMGPFAGHNDRRVMFEREILQSSALGYRAKRDLVTKLVNELELLPGKEKNTLGSLLKKVMEWRNAFAHGKIQHDSKTGCLIKYYSGEPKTLALTDDYWSDVESSFKNCDALLTQAHKAVGAKIPPNSET